MKIQGSHITLVQLSEHQTRLLLTNRMEFFRQYLIPYEEQWPSNAIKAALPLYYETLINGSETNFSAPWMIQLLETNQIIGEFHTKKRNRSIELGYHIFLNYRNKGFATEAIKLFCEFMQGVANIDKLTANCALENSISKHILQKNGFHITIKEASIITLERSC